MTIIGILFSSITIPAYAEVETIHTDKLFYSNGDTIIFSGTVDYDSTGLVS
ncbi:MAG: SHOCT domain-containing protein, partial [Thaumarchaeota archaeon]|nr:SHOCT domain-containing protein [Nitrososphaerota archaeon]